MTGGQSFTELVDGALAAPFTGWDFSYLRGRASAAPLPWDYPAEVARLTRGASCLLDLGTGGGEVLSRLERPARTVATEAFAPNAAVAAARLRPLGVPVVRCEPAPDNITPDPPAAGRLPFASGAFAVVDSRHESFTAREVARVLRPGGWFITQQVDLHSYDAFYTGLGLPAPPGPDSWLPLAQEQVTAAGLAVMRAEAGDEVNTFTDIGAVTYYLRVIRHTGYGPDPAAHRPALARLHARMATGPFTVRQRRFLLLARKP